MTTESKRKSEGWQTDATTKAAKDRKWTKIEAPDFSRFGKPGDSIEGKLLKVGQTKFRNGTAGKYTVELETGEEVTFNGSVRLDDLMADVPINSFVRITYTGDTKTGSNFQMRNFDVEVAG